MKLLRFDVPPDAGIRKTAVREIAEIGTPVRMRTLGNSVLGRKLYALEIGQGHTPVCYAGGFHGQEWITVLFLLNFAWDLGTSLRDGRKINNWDAKEWIEKFRIIIVPCVNPDGVEIALHGPEAAGALEPFVRTAGEGKGWQANARGVDLNHNFNAGWQGLRKLERENGITGPGPTRYGGPVPESEPETRAIVRCCRVENFARVLAFHSQGEEIYWDFQGNAPEGSREMAEKIGDMTGYRVAQPERLASAGGFKDWFLKEFGRPGFTLEIGKGKNPIPANQIGRIYRQLERMAKEFPTW